MPEIDRRTALKAGAAVALAGPSTVSWPGMANAAPPSSAAQPTLVPVPDQRDGVVRLALPRGFPIARSSPPLLTPSRNGLLVPGRHDGMAAFPGPDGTISTVVTGDGVVFASRASLNASMGNFAGGPMPWDSSGPLGSDRGPGPDLPDGHFRPHAGAEFAGSTFSPDGYTQYVNLQASAGISIAIFGNWTQLGL